MFAMINIDGYIRFALVIGAFFAFRQKEYDKYIYYILGASIVAFFVTGGFDPIWARLKIYVFTDAVVSSKVGLNLHFYSVMQTVREAGKISFETFANRISGNPIIFVLSIVGYIYLSFKHRIMLFALPMIGLGFLASVGGLRFTIYAVPILAFGIAFLITEITRLITDKKGIKYLAYLVFTAAILYPNIKHIEGYKVPTVFNIDEVEVLDSLKGIADRDDYVVAWWDYGYPIRYYSDTKTLADGGKHNGAINFPVSYMLTAPQGEAAKMARLDVEYTEKAFKTIEANKELAKDEKVKLFLNIEEMTKDSGLDDTNDFLLSLQTDDIEIPKKTRDIYFYLPYRMLNIYPVVQKFSNLNLMSGDMRKSPFFFISRNFQETQTTIEFGNGVALNKRDNSITIGKEKVPVRRTVTTGYDKQMKLQKNVKLINFSAPLTLIYMSNYKTFLIIDEQTYNSLYIQLMVLEEYDETLFQEVTMTPQVKLYKLKI